jgi:endo-1,4-beta-mannosidase
MRERALAVAALVVLCACGGGSPRARATPPPAPAATPATALAPPTLKGLNYDGPAGRGGDWLGTRWLRPGDGGWSAARPSLQADLDFIASHDLGRTVRLFIGLDQLMVWDRSTGFTRFDGAALANLDQALGMFDAHHLAVVAVVFDQEELGGPGNFHVEALDGRHAAMRAHYLDAVEQFFHRYGSRPTVVGWDLFNEAYNSLGREGGLPRPPAADPVSPNYPDATVHAWIQDLYRAAKRGAPGAWLTVSDTTELYWKDPPDVARYAGAVDFYDIHIYDDHPAARSWARTLDRPYLLGEVGGDYDHGFKDQSVNSRVVAFWLSQARALGIRAVLAHSSEGSVYSLRTGLTATGRVIEAAP